MAWILPIPGTSTPAHTLKPSTHGSDNSASAMPFTRQARLRDQPHSSMLKLMMFSNTATTVDSAAKLMNRKNSVPPQLPHRHLAEHAGKRDEHQAGPLPGSTPNAKHAGKMNEARHDGHERVQPRDAQRLARKAVAFIDVAAEDGHGPHAHRHREERLAHSREHGIDERPPPAFEQLREIGHEIERQALFRRPEAWTARTTSTARTANRAAIIVFVMRSTPLRKPARVTNTPISTTTSMNATIISGSARSPLNTPSTAPASRPLERARAAERHERQHPSGNRGVEHHQQVIARKGRPLEPMPFRPGPAPARRSCARRPSGSARHTANSITRMGSANTTKKQQIQSTNAAPRTAHDSEGKRHTFPSPMAHPR